MVSYLYPPKQIKQIIVPNQLFLRHGTCWIGGSSEQCAVSQLGGCLCGSLSLGVFGWPDGMWQGSRQQRSALACLCVFPVNHLRKWHLVSFRRPSILPYLATPLAAGHQIVTHQDSSRCFIASCILHLLSVLWHLTLLFQGIPLSRDLSKSSKGVLGKQT